MKTAVSVPEEVFDRAERLARRVGVSRSELYSRALREYVARHAPDDVTQALNDAIAGVGSENGAFAASAGRRILEHVEW